MKSRLVHLFAALRPKSFALLALVPFFSNGVYAASYTFAGVQTSTTLWSSGSGWTGTPVSSTSTTLLIGSAITYSSAFSTTGTNDFTSPFLLNALVLQATNNISTYPITFTIGGGALDFRSNGSVAPVVSLNANRRTTTPSPPTIFTVNNDIIANDGLTFNGNGTGAFIFGGVISGTNGIVKSGTSTLTLTGNNTFTGTTTLSGGSLQIGNNGTSGLISGDIVNNAALVFNRTDSSTFNGTISGNGTTTIASGTLLVGDGGTSDPLKSANLVVNGNLVLNRSGDFTPVNVLTGTGTFTKLGAGTMTLTDQAFRGVVAVAEGGLFLTNASTLSSGSVQVDPGASLLFGNYGTVSVGGLQGAGSVNFVNSNGTNMALILSGADTTAAFTGTLTGMTSITKTGTGTTTLSGTNNFQAPISVTGGTLGLGSVTGFGDVSNSISIGSAGTLMTAASINIPYTIAFANSATVNSNGFNATYTAGLGNFTTTLNKVGAGTFSLGGSSTVTGDLHVTGGALGVAPGATLRIGNGGTAGTITGDGNGGVAVNGTLIFDRSDSSTQGFNLSGSGALTKLGTGTLTLIGNNNFSGSMDLTGTLNLTYVDGASGTSGLSGNITGPGSLSTRYGTMTLSGNNSYSGGTTFNTTRINLGSDSALGTGPVTFNDQSNMLGTDAIRTVANPIINAGAVTVGGGLTLSGPMTLAANASVAATSNAGVGIANQPLVLSGDITGPYSLSIDVSTAAEMIISGHNTFTGGMKITSAKVSIYADSAFGAAGAPVYLYNATLKALAPLTINRDISVPFSGSVIFDTNGFASTLSGAVPTNFNFTVTGGGGLNYTGSSTFYIPAIDSSTTLTLSGGGVFGGTSTFVPVLNNGTLIVDGALASSNGTAIKGTGPLLKMGTGVLTLGSTSSFSGGTTITGGTVAFSAAANFGTGPITLNGAQLTWLTGNNADISSRLTIGEAGGTLNFNSPVTLASALSGGPVTVNAPGTLTLTAGGTLASLNIASGSVILGSSSPMQIGVLSGSASSSLVLGTGTLTLTNPSTYAGNISLTSGTLAVGGESVLGTKALSLNGSALQSSGGAHTLANPTTLNADTTFNGNQPLTLSGAMTLTGFKPVNVTNTARTTISGSIGESSPGIFIKQGAGELQLTGANTYSGGTFIAAGTVRINNPTGSAFGTGAVTVAPGAILAGSGSFTGALQLNGTYSPGNSPGTAHTGAQTWAGGAGYIWEANNATGTAGTHTDLLAINGSLTINATSANPFAFSLVSLLGDNSAGALANFNGTYHYTFPVVTTTSGITGFSPLAFTVNTAGFVNDLHGGTWSLAQVGHSLNLSFVPVDPAGPNTTTFATGLTLAAGGNLDFQLGIASDLIDVASGPLTGPFTGTITVNLSDSGGFGAGTYDLIHYTTLADGSLNPASFALGSAPAGYNYQFNLTASALQLTVTAVPEPAAIAAIFAGAAFATVLIRRRRTG